MIILRKATEGDLEVIRELAAKVWWPTYSAYLSEEQIEYMLGKMYNKGELLSQFSQGHTFLIASEEGDDLGFAGFSPAGQQHEIFKLHKLYVLPGAHGKGLGKLLIKEVCDLAKRSGASFMQLNVNRNNKAVSFYEKAGFRIIETVDLDIGQGFFMNDYVMQKSL